VCTSATLTILRVSPSGRLRKEWTARTENAGFQQWGSANCGENFERALHDYQWMVKELTESEQAAQESLSQIRPARLRSCRDPGYHD
jgi:hypothetical protein